MSYLTAIAKARQDIFRDNEEPRDILISAALKHAIRAECGLYPAYGFEFAGEQLMGMKIEWTDPKPLTEPQMAIRTAKGDTRIVSYIQEMAMASVRLGHLADEISGSEKVNR